MRKIFTLVIPLLLIACANTETVQPPTLATASANQVNDEAGTAKIEQTAPIQTATGDAKPQSAAATPAIEFYDSAVFDEKLGQALTDNAPVVEVKTISPFSVNQIPQRLDVWLSAAVHEYGGKVETKPDPAYPQSKAIIGEIIDLVVSVYDAVKKKTTYGAAENYNLTVYYKPGTGTVTKMVFTHK
jgi:hypothetical protein